MVSAVQRRVQRLSTPSVVVLGPSLQARHQANNWGAGSELQNIDPNNAQRRTAPGTALPPLEETSGTQTAGDGAAADVPAEVEAQGSSARRAFLRQQLAQQQEREYTEAAAEARAVDERRPLCEYPHNWSNGTCTDFPQGEELPAGSTPDGSE